MFKLLEINKQAAQYYYYQLRTEGGKPIRADHILIERTSYT